MQTNELDVKNFELFYPILKFILNMSKNKNLIIKNIFLNLSETIHIYLRKGKSSIIQIQNLLKLFIYLFKKKTIINILSKMPKILIKIFRSIFVSFHIQESKLEKNNLDFINQNNNDDNNNSDDIYFPNIIISKEKFLETIELNSINFISNSKEIYELYKQFIIILFKNGTENGNKNIFNIFKIFYEKETDSIFKAS